MSQTRLLFVPPLASAVASYCLMDRAGNIIGRGVLDPERMALQETMPTIAVVPGADVLVRWLDLPVGSLAQVQAAARWQLKDHLAGDVEGLDLALGPVPSDGGRRLVAAASTSLIQTWLDWCTTWGIRPEALIPDCLCLPVPPGHEDETLAAHRGADVLLRGPEMAVAVQADMVEAVMAGRALSWLEDQDLETLLAKGARQVPLNLLEARDQKARGQGLKQWRLAAGLLGALMISPLILMAAQGGREARQTQQLQQQAQAAAVRLYPDLATSQQAASEALIRLDSAPPPGGMSRTMAVIFTAVEGLEGAELQEVALTQEGLRLTLSHVVFADLDSLRSELAQAGLEVRDDNTVEEEGRMLTTLMLGGGR